MKAFDNTIGNLATDFDQSSERESNDEFIISIFEEICKEKLIVKTRDNNNYYVQLENPIDGNKKTYSFHDSEFCDFVRVRYFNKTWKTISNSKLNDAISTFKALLSHQQNGRLQVVERLSNRVHGDIRKRKILYDLSTDTGEVIEITEVGWKIIHLDTPIFRKSNTALPQVVPNQSYNVENFDKSVRFWNRLEYNSIFRAVPEEEFKLFMIYLVYCFIPQLPKPILLLRGDGEDQDEGEGGSGKSTLIRLVKQIVDPSSSELSSIPKETKDLKILLSDNHYTPFDNVTYINSEVSDTLCQGVTGGSISSRKLYTDGDLNTIRYKNCIAINGINLRKIKPDLKDRAIIFDIPRIDDLFRRTESDIEERFEKLLPELLRRIFDVLSKVLMFMATNPEEVDEIKNNNLPRMADFAVYGEIISRIMFGDKCKNEFFEYYKNKTIAQNGNWGTDGQGLENHAVIQGLLKLRDILERRYPINEEAPDKEDKSLIWQGSFTELFDYLSRIIAHNKILTASDLKDPKLFPQAANSFSRIVNTLQPVLKKLGINIYVTKTNNARRDKIITLEMKYSSQLNSNITS
ncbi:MAG: hypothetical protein AB7P13_05150 [Candidatus Nitrosocosmicus sp.]